jgi:hypothetical protein
MIHANFGGISRPKAQGVKFLASKSTGSAGDHTYALRSVKQREQITRAAESLLLSGPASDFFAKRLVSATDGWLHEIDIIADGNSDRRTARMHHTLRQPIKIYPADEDQ